MESTTILLGGIAVSSVVTAIAAVKVAIVVNGINNRSKVWYRNGPVTMLDTVKPPPPPPPPPPGVGK
jgi:hypothetical protein